MIRTSLLLLCWGSWLGAEPLEYKGNLTLDTAYIDHDLPDKWHSQNALRLEMELKQPLAQGELLLNAQGLYDTKDSKRRYLNLHDLYYKHAFDNSDLLIGRTTRFWGAMEFYNQSDLFNTKDWRDNPFDYDRKIGAWNLAYTYYFDNADLSLITKLHEEEQRVQDQHAIDNLLPNNYHADLETQAGQDRPTLYLKYAGSGEEIQLDYALIYQNGYDGQRYLVATKEQLHQYAYLVNKVMGYATLISGETLYKTELAYTLSDDHHVADYAQGSIGLEHTLYGVIHSIDLGLIAEYYRYQTQENKKLDADDFGQLFDNDLALGFRMTLNDDGDSDLLGGVIMDQDNHEKIYALEYNTRLKDHYKLKLTFEHFTPKRDSLFPKEDRSSLSFGYYF